VSFFENLSPVFIMGCPRSGTTMMASQLANAENAIALPEMQYIYPLLQDFQGPIDVGRAYRRLIDDFRFQVSDVQISENEFSAAAKANGGIGIIAKIIENYAYGWDISIDEANAIHWIEHAPETGKNTVLINRALPQARFIHIVRDPRSVYLSMLRLRRWNIWDPHKFTRIWSDAVGRCYRIAAQRPQQVIEVRYEDILSNPANELSKVCSFLGLGFKAEMLNGGAVRLPEFTVEQHALTATSVKKEKIDGWRKQIDERDAEIIEAELTDWMVHYGYIDTPRDLRTATEKEKLKFAMRTFLRTPGAKLRDAIVRAKVRRSAVQKTK